MTEGHATLTVARWLNLGQILLGRVIMFFKASVGPGVHTARSDSHSLASVEEYWWLPEQPTDPLCSEFKCVRLYSTTPKVYYVIDTWRILGPAPIMRNTLHPTIPHSTLPKSAQQRTREYPSATEDSKPGSLSLSFSYSVCLTLLNCCALSAALSCSCFLAVSLNNSQTLGLSLDVVVSFCLSWFFLTVNIWNSLSLSLCQIFCVDLSLSICLSRIFSLFLDLFQTKW